MNEVCEICGFSVSRGNLESHLKVIAGMVEQGQGLWLLTLNTEMISRGLREPDYWRLIKQADIVTADGAPLVWAASVKYPKASVAGRTTGVDLVDSLLRQERVLRFAVIGGARPFKTIELYGPAAIKACTFLFYGKVDLSESQLDFFCEELKRHQTKLVFIALGVPKQDDLAMKLRLRMPHLVLLGIGGAFEILGPDGRRAPYWMQRAGLEWLFRFCHEPRRLWRRYLISYPRGIWFLAKDCLTSNR